MKSSNQTIYALRLFPNDDLKNSLLAFAQKNNLKAAYIITCVGSLQKIHLRTANAVIGKPWEQKVEIVSLVGTLFNGGCHLHISLSDEQGHTVGGHLLEGCLIYTTAEIVIGEASGMTFTREVDPVTGYLELKISP